MIDQWFKNDLQNIYSTHAVAVFIDESGDAEFLLKSIENKYIIHYANTELEELHVKYLIEQSHPAHEKFLIYTHSKKERLSFIREYCETNGCLDFCYLQNYIKEKVHQALNLNIQLPKDELIAAAKVSMGKDRDYWLTLSHKGAAEIFDLKKELLPFLHDPESYDREKYDAQLRETFYRKVNDLLGQEYIPKPAMTLASEVVKTMLDGLAEGRCKKTLEAVYKNWLDSVSFRDSFKGYLGDYILPENLDVSNVSIHHPFCQIDEKWLADIGSQLNDSTEIANILKRIRQRHQSRQAQSLGITFWADVDTLLEFDPKNISYLSTFNECVTFYRKYFFKLDTAIRNLYTAFLNKKEILEPFQECYKAYIAIFLDQWFKHWNGYKETQSGLLQKIINESDVKTAVIVGDGIAYEIAEQMASQVKEGVSLSREIIIADIPSETENNMSRIYMDNGALEPVQKNREKYLVAQNPDITIDFISLDEVNENEREGQFLIVTYKDMDDMGEKFQQKALKYFPETIDFFAEKISLLLATGYAKVYLISDHGFVLTGILSESDKISVSPKGRCNKSERYIRTKDKQPDLMPRLIEVEKSGKGFGFLYFAQNMNPFKTPGVYGFSHGGISPQELITPFFCWAKSKDTAALLSVHIENKADLKDVTGELFTIKISAAKSTGDLFSMERSVYLIFFADKTQLNKSEVFTIRQGECITREYTFDKHPKIEVQLLDAETKQQLDRTIVHQNKERDLGGLL